MTAVTGPPVETPVPWEYPTGVWALLPWSGRPVTPHCSMWRPGAGGRSITSPVDPVYGGSAAHYQAGTTCHIALAVILRLPLPHTQATRISLPMSRYPHEPLPPFGPAKGRRQARPLLPHRVKQHHP